MKCPCCQRQVPANKPSIVNLVKHHEDEDAYLNVIVSRIVDMLALEVQRSGRDGLNPAWRTIDSLLRAFNGLDADSAASAHAVEELLSLERSLNR